MQSIRDQAEEGEHILSLDLQSVQTAAQSTGICRGEVTKLGPHYAVHKSSRSGYRTITLIVIRIFLLENLFILQMGDSSKYMN